MWKQMYDSILEAWSRDFELIIVSHLPLLDELKNIPNVKLIYDKGNPTRKRQIALTQATGKYTTWFVDDGVYGPESLDEVYETIGFGSTVSFKFGDCLLNGKYNPIMATDKYYEFNNFPPILMLNGIPKKCKTLSFGVMPTHLLKTIGGWDCRFEHLPMAESDLSIRLNKLGYKITVSPDVMIKLPHVVGTDGDHAPVHFAQTENDEPLFKSMYKDDSNKDRTIIDINNWRDSPEIWARRA